MKQQRESILKLLELKNEQSFYIKQRQNKKIINFLKSLPTSQIVEFNNYDTNSFSELSLEMSYYAIKKQIKLIHILYEINGTIKDKTFFNKNLKLHNPVLFSKIVSSISQDNAIEKLYDVAKTRIKQDIIFEHNLLLDFDEEHFKNNLFQWIPQYFESKEIKRSDNLGVLLNFISNLNEYDIIFMINNYVNDYKPFISCLHLFENSNELEIIKEHILDQLFFNDTNRYNPDTRFTNYKEEKLNSNNINELFKSIIK